MDEGPTTIATMVLDVCEGSAAYVWHLAMAPLLLVKGVNLPKSYCYGRVLIPAGLFSVCEY